MRCVKDLLGDFKEQCMAESFSHAYVFWSSYHKIVSSSGKQSALPLCLFYKILMSKHLQSKF